MQRFLVPRELVLKRVWRRDADGTFNVLMQSIDHRACPPTPGMVRAHISAMCFTIAPLKVRLPYFSRLPNLARAAACPRRLVCLAYPAGWGLVLW